MKTALDPLRWKALALLCAAQFIVILDTSIIGVALPAIESELGFTSATLPWVFNAYVIAFGGLLLLGGRLADLFGRRRVFMAGFAILTVASLVAGAAWSDLALVISRALQGVGAALIAPAALSFVMSLFPDPRELGKALGFWGASAAAGGSAGVFLGGVITEWASWRWTFFINVPLGVAVLLGSLLLLKRGARARGTVDVLGASTVTTAIGVLVYAVVTAAGRGWAEPMTVGLFAAGAALLALFAAIQSKRAEPLIPLKIFSVPNLSAGNLITALLAGSWIPLWFFLNLYLQQTLGYSALEGGLALLPMTASIMLLMMGVTGKVVARFGFKPNLVVGLLLLAAALLLFARAPSGGSFVVDVLPASLLAALGMSLAYIPATIASMSGARPEETGLASGLVNTSYQVGSALGLATVVAVVQSLNGGTAAEADTLLAGFHVAFYAAAGIAFAGALIAVVALRARNDAAASSSTAPVVMG